MHELSIAMSIVEMAEEESHQRGDAKVCAVHLKLGALAGVVKKALLSSYEMACEGTCLAGSRLVIEDVPITVYCAQCLAPRKLESMQLFVCPECKEPESQVLEGRELQVVALELLQ
jgi:hydrogenase nickel incorporation protein HypA/HybF